MMGFLFFLFFVGALVPLYFYKDPTKGAKYGFSLSAGVSLVSCFYFLFTLHSTQGFTLFGNFLFSPKFLATPFENFFCFLVSFIACLGSLFSLSYAKVYEKKANLSLFASMYNFFILSMLLVITSDNVFSFLLLWEVMTLLSACLIMINDEKNAGHTIMVYLGVAQFGAFCLVGALVIMGYGAGSFVFSDFANLKLSSGFNALAFILLFIGFGSKAGLWPFHFWLKEAYAIAPSNVCALMSGVMIKVGIFAFIKFSLFLTLSPALIFTMLFFAGMSVVIGALYAAVQENSKSAVAYSSSENAGIIFLGLGAGFYGYSQNIPVLATLGFVGALFHILNHATFKSLMFFGCGSVYKQCGTNDLNRLGGLAKKMPKTALCFLIATIAITALPPLNGFASEWVTYKSLLLGGVNDGVGERFFFIFGILFLALGGTVALFAFVKVYGAIFSGQQRDKSIFEKAKENDFTMLVPLFILAFCCIGFGISAKSIGVGLSNLVSQKLSTTALNSADIIAMPNVVFVFLLALLVGFIGLILFKANFTKARVTEPWASGYKYDTNMQIGSHPFSGDLRHIMKFFYRHKTSVIEQDGYFGKVTYKSETEDVWWSWVDKYIVKTTCKIADKIGIFQNGQTNIYAGYILLYMTIMLVCAYYFLGGL